MLGVRVAVPQSDGVSKLGPNGSVQLGQLKSDLTETEGAINRLVGMVEAGLMDVGDPALAERLEALKAKRASLQSQISTASAIRGGSHRLRIIVIFSSNDETALRIHVAEPGVPTGTIACEHKSLSISAC